MAEMNKRTKILSVLVVFVLLLTQAFVLMPAFVYGAKAGADLEIRVQYYGERGDKLRTKATYSRSELSQMGASTYCYSNVTNVGTVMVMKARGPKVSTILSNAGIDVGSVQNITFRTTDGYTRNFSSSQITASRYYYPKLNLYSYVEEEEEPTEPTQPAEPDKPTEPAEPSEPDKPTEPAEPTEPAGEASVSRMGAARNVSPMGAGSKKKVLNYERSSDGTCLTPREGSLSGGSASAPAILALEFGSTKSPGKSAESLSMSTYQTYRFCIGQSKLYEGKRTAPGYDGGDVSSMESAHSIYGIDVTLYGSPVKGVNLSLLDKNTKVGSTVRVKAEIVGDELFNEYLDTSTLSWKSSDTKIATVDKNGNVTIKKKGKVTITATAKDGTSGSLVIGGDQGANADAKGTNAKDKNAKDATGIKVREISIGKEILPEVDETLISSAGAASSDTQALDEGESFSGKAAATAGIVAALACGAGAIIRIRRFKISMK